MQLVALAKPSPCQRSLGFKKNLKQPISNFSRPLARAGPYQDPKQSQEPLELPGGAFWWVNDHYKARENVIYGNEFIIQRHQVGGPGLVPASKKVHVQRYSNVQNSKSGPPAVYNTKKEVGLALSGAVVVDTEFTVIVEDEDAPAPTSPNLGEQNLGTDCVGIVYIGSADSESFGTVQDAGETNHPRRTRKIKFTCNLCGEENVKPINPHAWKTGSVFARCNGCDVVHKLQDNLKIFHELGGPVFPPPHLRDSFLVQEVLDKIAARRRNYFNDN